MNQPTFLHLPGAFCISSGSFLLVLLFLSLTSCGREEAQDDGPKVYYDLKGFIENQIIYLNDKKPEISKTARLGGKSEVSTTREVDWKKELELFVQADLNKPSYRQSYDIARSDSMRYEYKVRANVNLPVRYLKIETDSVLKQPLYIEALIHTSNKIYDSEKKIVMWLGKKDNLLQVNSYEVDGYQKLVLMDKKVFSIRTKIGL
nr:hypothetical protein [uncultured Dyadobacter sp.]